jgi:hypothetical protein
VVEARLESAASNGDGGAVQMSRCDVGWVKIPMKLIWWYLGRYWREEPVLK